MLVGVGTFEAGPKAISLVNEVLASGRISYGPMSQRFERELAALHDCAYGVLSNSGTSSLHVALQAMKELHGWPDGSEVIVPALTFVATVNVVLHNNLVPVLVDVEPDLYGIDANRIEEKITEKTKAILPVHTFGQPCDMAHVIGVAQWYRLKVIEDACETLLVKHLGVPVGGIGDIGVFSFYVAHLLTCGIGGMTVTNDKAYALKMRSLVNHGRDNVYISIDDTRNRLQEVIGKRFSFESVGHSFRITELEAALGLAQLDTIASTIAKRQRNFAFLLRALKPLEKFLQLPTFRQGLYNHACMMFPVVLKEGSKADICSYLEEHGIETRDMLPLVTQPVYANRFNPADYPVALNIAKNGFYIGCHQGLREDTLIYVAEKMASFYGYSYVLNVDRAAASSIT